MQLFKKLVLILVAASCGPLLVASWFLIRTNTEALRTSIFERHREQAAALARTVDLELVHVSAAVEGYVRQMDLSKLEAEERDNVLRFILGKHRDDLTAVSLWREADKEPLSIALFRDENATAHRRAVMTAAHDPTRASYTEVYTGDDSLPAVSLLIPVSGDATDRRLVLAAEVSLRRIQGEILRTRVGPGGDAFVVDRRGRVIAATDERLVRSFADYSANPIVALSAGGQLSGSSDFVDEGREMLGAYAPAPALGWTVVVQEPKDDALAPAHRMLRDAIVVAALTMVGACVAAVVFARGLSAPIQKVVSGSLAIARGRFGARVNVQRKDEIGELAHTFNYMSQQLSDYDAENKKLLEGVQQGYIETIRALANSIDAKDPYTRGHSQRVTDYAVEIARELKLSEDEVDRIQFGAILHDIGKVGIKDKVLSKAGQLTEEEYEYMKTHPLLGLGIVDPIEFLRPVKAIIRGHHERWDGGGYPDGLKGEDIDIGARIVNIADSWDAMVTQRPYNTPMTFDQGVARLKQIAGTQHDPRVTEAFLAILARHRAEELEGERWREEEAAKMQGKLVELPGNPKRGG